MEEKLIDLNEVARMMSMHPKSMRKIIREDKSFPKEIIFSERVKRWKYSDILKWIDSKHKTHLQES